MSDPPAAKPDELQRLHGEAWFRMHFDGRLLADLRWLGHHYAIAVFRLPEHDQVADRCCTEEPGLARVRADRLVQESYPHDCASEQCAPWMRYTQA